MTAAAVAQADLFATCIIDQLYPQVGVSVVRVLRKLGVKVGFPPGQTCCGQPMYNSGYAAHARQLARRVIDGFRHSPAVVVPSGSCAAMITRFYPELFRDEPDTLEQARSLASRTFEFSQYLCDVLKVDDAGAAWPATAAYHPSCHLLREMEVREAPLRLLRNVRGLRLADLPNAEVCCGFGGAFSVKYPHISEGMAGDKADSAQNSGADALVSCDMGCLMNVAGVLARRGSGIRVLHLAQVLDGQ